MLNNINHYWRSTTVDKFWNKFTVIDLIKSSTQIYKSCINRGSCIFIVNNDFLKNRCSHYGRYMFSKTKLWSTQRKWITKMVTYTMFKNLLAMCRYCYRSIIIRIWDFTYAIFIIVLISPLNIYIIRNKSMIKERRKHSAHEIDHISAS